MKVNAGLRKLALHPNVPPHEPGPHLHPPLAPPRHAAHPHLPHAPPAPCHHMTIPVPGPLPWPFHARAPCSNSLVLPIGTRYYALSGPLTVELTQQLGGLRPFRIPFNTYQDQTPEGGLRWAVRPCPVLRCLTVYILRNKGAPGSL